MLHTDAAATGFIFGLAKIIPIILFAAGGYFVFIKLPFFVFLKVLRTSKGLPQTQLTEFKWQGNDFKPEYTVDNYEAFLRRRKRAQEAEERYQTSSDNVLKFERIEKNETPEESKQRLEMNERRKKYAEELKVKAEEQQRRSAQQKEQQRQQRKENDQKANRARQEREQQEQQKRYQSGQGSSDPTSPESIFNLRPGENFTQDELKRRYRDLVKTNHPDKVATEGTQVRQLADKKTKEINSAYDKLKSKAG